MWKTQDPDHAHVKSKDDGLEYLARNGYMGAGDTSTENTSTDTSQGAHTVDVPGGDDSSSPETPDPDSLTSDPSCPDCDAGPDAGDVYDADEYLEAARADLPNKTAEAIEDHEYVCTDCWMAFP